MQSAPWRRWHRVGHLVSPFVWLRIGYHVADASLFRVWWAFYSTNGRLLSFREESDRLWRDSQARRAGK